jgi:hypothetical protein
VNVGRLTGFILAACVALGAPPALATRTPIDPAPGAIAEARAAPSTRTSLIAAVCPLGRAEDGDLVELAVLVDPETHTPAICVVKSPLGLEVLLKEGVLPLWTRMLQ